MKVELIETPTEITLESLQEYLAKCSSVVRNKDPKDASRLWERLLKESYGDKASRVFEYIPCVVDNYEVPPLETNSAEQEPHQYFGFFKRDKYYTNMRELLNWGWSIKNCIAVVDFTYYKAVRITVPYFMYGQMSTHNQITSVSHSARYTEANLGYWMPDYVKIYMSTRSYESQENWEHKVENYSPKMLENFMKNVGEKRREVYSRGKDMLAYRPSTLGGYVNNPNAWPHFINQRMRDPHTQLETRQMAEMIAKEIGL